MSDSSLLNFCVCATLFTAVGSDLCVWEAQGQNSPVLSEPTLDKSTWGVEADKPELSLNANDPLVQFNSNTWVVNGEATKLVLANREEDICEWLTINTDTQLKSKTSFISTWSISNQPSKLISARTDFTLSSWEVSTAPTPVPSSNSVWFVNGRSSPVVQALTSGLYSLWLNSAFPDPIRNEDEDGTGLWEVEALQQIPRATLDDALSKWEVLASFGDIVGIPVLSVWDVITDPTITALGEDPDFLSVISEWEAVGGDLVPIVSGNLFGFSVWNTLGIPTGTIRSFLDSISQWGILPSDPTELVSSSSQASDWTVVNTGRDPLVKSEAESQFSVIADPASTPTFTASGLGSQSVWDVVATNIELAGTGLSQWLVQGFVAPTLSSSLTLSAWITLADTPAQPLVGNQTSDWSVLGLNTPLTGNGSSAWTVDANLPLTLLVGQNLGVWTGDGSPTPVFKGGNNGLWEVPISPPQLLPELEGSSISEWQTIALPAEIGATIQVLSTWSVTGERQTQDPCLLNLYLPETFGWQIKATRSSLPKIVLPP